MKSIPLSGGGSAMFALVFAVGDEVVAGLQSAADELGLGGAEFTAIGALRDVTLGYWNIERRDYDRIRISEQVEVLSMIGNIAMTEDGGRKVHAHIVVGKADGTAHGGHLLEAHVRPTLEIVLTESPQHLRRRHDERTGLALLYAATPPDG